MYGKNRIDWIILAVSIASIVWFFIINRDFPFNMYGRQGGHLKWLLYFIFMLLGAKLEIRETTRQMSSIKSLSFALLGIVFFYAFYLLGLKVEKLEYLEILNFIPLFFAVYYLYQWGGDSPMAKSLYQNRVVYFLVRFIGGLCLEIYLIQSCFFTDALNHLFPLNIPIIFIVIVVAAYLSRCFARFISQTFKESHYDWKKMISIY